MDLERAVESAGLAGSEAKAYLALLQLGEATGVKVSQTSGLYKANCYAALEKLSEKGLATIHVEEGVRHYRPASPSRLVELIKEQEDGLTGAMPELHKLYAIRREERDIEILSGREGHKRILDEIASQGSKRYLYRAFYEAHPLEARTGYLPYEKKLFKGKVIHSRALQLDTPVTRRSIRERIRYEPFFYDDVRFIRQKGSIPIQWSVIGDSLWIGFTSGIHAERVYLRVESKDLCDAFEIMFNEQWDQQDRTKRIKGKNDSR